MTDFQPGVRLAQARELILGVMDELDIELIDCPCPEHARHYHNWSDAQTHERLVAIAHSLHRAMNGESITALDQAYREHSR